MINNTPLGVPFLHLSRHLLFADLFPAFFYLLPWNFFNVRLLQIVNLYLIIFNCYLKGKVSGDAKNSLRENSTRITKNKINDCDTFSLIMPINSKNHS